MLLRPDDVEAAWQRAVAGGPGRRTTGCSPRPSSRSTTQVTLLTVRTTGPAGPALHFCEPIGHRERDGGLLEAWQPQQLSAAALDAAKSIAARIVNALGGRGVFGVELLVRGDEVYFSDVRTAAARQRAGHPALAAAVGVRAARPGHPGTAGGHHHDFAGRRGGHLRRRRDRTRRDAPANATCGAGRRAGRAESDVRLFGPPRRIDARRGSALRWPPRPTSTDRPGPGAAGRPRAAQAVVAVTVRSRRPARARWPRSWARWRSS